MIAIERREFLRTGLLSLGAVAAPGLLAACSGKPTQTAPPATLQDVVDRLTGAGGKQAVDVFLAGEDWVQNIENHLSFGLVRRGGDPITGAEATIWLAPTPDLTGKPVGPFKAAWRGYAKPEAGGPQGVNAVDVTFGGAGFWTMLVDVGPQGSRLFGTAAIQV
ncbi:MAG: hypothetical protein ACRDKS_07990, partial [Actinomycetota bacterium]